MQPTNVIETYVCKLLLRFIVLQHVNSRRPRMHFCKMLYNRKLCPCSTLLLHLLLHLLHTQLSSALQHHHTLHYNIPVSHLQVQPLQGDAPLLLHVKCRQRRPSCCHQGLGLLLRYLCVSSPLVMAPAAIATKQSVTVPARVELILCGSTNAAACISHSMVGQVLETCQVTAACGRTCKPLLPEAHLCQLANGPAGAPAAVAEHQHLLACRMQLLYCCDGMRVGPAAIMQHPKLIQQHKLEAMQQCQARQGAMARLSGQYNCVYT